MLRYTDGITRAKLFLDDIEKATNVRFVDIHLPLEIRFFHSLNKKISFTDATLIQLASQVKGRLISFDKQMLKIAKQIEKA